MFAEVYKTPEIALTVYVVFFLNKPDRTSSMLLTVAIVLIITAVVGIILLIAPPLLANSGLRVLTMALISFVMMFLGSASKLKPVASILALVIAYALDILGSVPLGEAATRGVLYLWLFFAIPALVSIVVNLLIAPSPRSLVQREIAERLLTAAAALAQANRAGHYSMRPILMGDVETQKHLKLAGLENTSSEEDIAALKGASDCVITVLSAVQLMLDETQARPTQNVERPKIFLAGTGAYVSGQVGLTAIPGIGQQLPTLNITGNQWNGTILLGVSIPIFDAHRRANAIQQAKNDEDKAAATLNEVRLNAVREIVSTQISLRSSLAANDAASVSRTAAQTSYDAALDSYKQGVGTVTAAVEAETHLFEAELAESDAYTSALSAAVTLAFATGQLGAAPR
jgi:hypothetical protein